MLSRLALCLGATLRVRHPAPTCGDPSPDSLTLQEMGSRLAEVRAHYRSTGDLEQSFVCRNLMATRVAGLELDRCAVAKSELHGEGLFATRDLEEGELITFYPGDALLIWADADRSPDRDVSLFFGAHVPEAERTRDVLGSQAREYEMTATATMSVVGDPARRDDPAYLGHFANDGASCSSPETAAREAYNQATYAACNAAHLTLEGCHTGTRAIRPIPKGAEVLVSYGENYWLSRAGHAAPVASASPVATEQRQLDRLRAARAPKTSKRSVVGGGAKKKAKRGAVNKDPEGGKGRGFG